MTVPVVDPAEAQTVSWVVGLYFPLMLVVAVALIGRRTLLRHRALLWFVTASTVIVGYYGSHIGLHMEFLLAIHVSEDAVTLDWHRRTDEVIPLAGITEVEEVTRVHHWTRTQPQYTETRLLIKTESGREYRLNPPSAEQRKALSDAIGERARLRKVADLHWTR